MHETRGTCVEDEEALGAFVTLGGKEDGDGEILADELRAFVHRL